MPYLFRPADQADVPELARLLADYLRETYGSAWGGSQRQLASDLSAGKLELLVAEDAGGQMIGFVAWIRTYDLHWCLEGAEIIDFYVMPARRGRGVGLLLTVRLAAEVIRRGGRFLKGGAVETAAVRRFYSRFAAILPNGECYVSGRAFRHLAGLEELTLREIVRRLPDAAWNAEA